MSARLGRSWLAAPRSRCWRAPVAVGDRGAPGAACSPRPGGGGGRRSCRARPGLPPVPACRPPTAIPTASPSRPTSSPTSTGAGPGRRLTPLTPNRGRRATDAVARDAGYPRCGWAGRWCSTPPMSPLASCPIGAPSCSCSSDKADVLHDTGEALHSEHLTRAGAVGGPAALLRAGAVPAPGRHQPARRVPARRRHVPVLRQPGREHRPRRPPQPRRRAHRGRTWSPRAGAATPPSATATSTRPRCSCGAARGAPPPQLGERGGRSGARAAGSPTSATPSHPRREVGCAARCGDPWPSVDGVELVRVRLPLRATARVGARRRGASREVVLVRAIGADGRRGLGRVLTLSSADLHGRVHRRRVGGAARRPRAAAGFAARPERRARAPDRVAALAEAALDLALRRRHGAGRSRGRRARSATCRRRRGPRWSASARATSRRRRVERPRRPRAPRGEAEDRARAATSNRLARRARRAIPTCRSRDANGSLPAATPSPDVALAGLGRA